MNLNPPEWHDYRSLLNKAFTSSKEFFHPMEKKIRLCILRWSHGYVNVGYDLQKLTLDVLATCIFGQDFDTLYGKNAQPLAAYNFCVEYLFSPFRIIFPWWGKLPLPINKKLNTKAKEFDDYCWSIIADVKKSCESKEDNPKHRYLIDLMIESGMPESYVRDNVGAFFLAGHETTSLALSWIMGMLACYPEVQEKARKEVLEKTPNGLEYESIKDLQYIDWIVRETLRFHPPAPLAPGRMTKKELMIGDWKIPPNTFIQIDFVDMLHNPKVWGDPQVFRPERWSPENLTKEQRTLWMPFSYGPRICIGMNFSLLEQKIFIATLLREFSKIQFAKDGELVVDTAKFLHAPDFKKLKIQCVK